MNTTIILRGKPWLVEEPTFGVLKKIAALYADASKSEKNHYQRIITIIKLLVDDPNLFPSGLKKLIQKNITPAELEAFIQAIPKICGFDGMAQAHETSEDPWGELYAFLAANHGYDWQQIDGTMTLSRWKLVNDYWMDYPPTNALKAAELGYKPKRQENFLETARRQAGQLH